MQRIAVIGLGTMGPGIVARLARGGCPVSAYDTAPAAIERAAGAVGAANGVLDRLGIVAPDSGPGEISFHHTLQDTLEGATFVIENVPEKIEIKSEVYQQIDALVPADAIVASDTSGIPITRLQAFLSNPARLVGMHWSNPPHIIPMIEVIAGKHTAAATVDLVMEFIRGLGLLPVRIRKDVPGFVENRVLYALLREAIDLVEQDVVDPEDLDICVSWGIGYKLGIVGPMALLDMAGLDIYESVASFLNAELSDRKDVAPLIGKRTSAGKFGMKSGEGLASYTPRQIEELQARRARLFVAVRRALEDGA